MTLSSQELKKLKELHVSNNLGSSKLPILLIGLNPVLNTLLFQILNKKFKIESYAVRVGIEFLTLILPLLVAIVFADYVLVINLSIIALTAALHFTLPNVKLSDQAKSNDNKNEKNDNDKDKAKVKPRVIKPYLTNYRSNLMLLTCICILAVDFNIFPKYLQKVETFGTSLMDVGVGAFVFSSGVVNSKAKKQNLSSLGLLMKSLKDSMPLWILGFARLISVKGLEYQEHVTEYGVHWNFFFTLATLPIFTQITDLIPFSTALKPWIIGISYQLLLKFTNLEDFILNSPRVDLISMNREGIFSTLGYLSIFLIGREIGKLMFADNLVLMSELVKKTVMYSTIDIVLSLAGVQNSRRMANLPYVTWVSSFNLALISLFYIIDKSSTHADSIIFNSLNFNGLITFLWGNILTGLTNMSINTLAVNNSVAFSILITYLALVLSLPLILFKLKIKIL